jgi:DNA-binding NtrC family response regulator
MRLLYAHDWPGNVRELENVIERGLVLCSGNEIMPSDLPEELRKRDAVFVPPGSLAGDPAPSGPGSPAGVVTCGGFNPSQGETGGPRYLPPGQPVSPRDEGEDFVAKAIAILPEGVGLEEAVSALHEAMLRKAMALGGGVQSRAADLLGLGRNSFKYKWDKCSEKPPSVLSEILTPVIPDGGDLVTILTNFEVELIRRALVNANGVLNLAADLLGLKRNVLPYKLKKYPGLVPTEPN